MWFWLAIIIKGRSQQERTSRGLDRASVAVSRLRWVHPVSHDFFIQIKLMVAINRLCTVGIFQVHFVGVNQVVGIKSRVGIRIFNIVEGLDF